MSDLLKRHLTDAEIARFVEQQGISKELKSHIDSCSECANLVASVLECSASEKVIEFTTMSATEKQGKLELLKGLLHRNDTHDPAKSPPKKTKGQRGNITDFFAGVMGIGGAGDLFDSNTGSPIPALGDKDASGDDASGEAASENDELQERQVDDENHSDFSITHGDSSSSIDLDELDSEAEDVFEMEDQDDDVLENDPPNLDEDLEGDTFEW